MTRSTPRNDIKMNPNEKFGGLIPFSSQFINNPSNGIVAIIMEALRAPSGPANFWPKNTKKPNPANPADPNNQSKTKFPSNLNAETPSFIYKKVKKITPAMV